jgi:hypothetical protein
MSQRGARVLNAVITPVYVKGLNNGLSVHGRSRLAQNALDCGRAVQPSPIIIPRHRRCFAVRRDLRGWRWSALNASESKLEPIPLGLDTLHLLLRFTKVGNGASKRTIGLGDELPEQSLCVHSGGY